MKGDIKKARKQASKKVSLNKEFKHKLAIAGLQVMTNDKIPMGVMIVNPVEGERLAKMVNEASAKQTKALVDERAKQLEDEARKRLTVYAENVTAMIAQIESAGGKVSRDEYAIYAIDAVMFEGDLADYPLDVITVAEEDMPEGTVCVVAKKELN